MSGISYNIGDKELVCEKYCIVLSDGTQIFRVVCDHCIDCDKDNYEVEYFTDEFGDKISTPDLTGAVSCEASLYNRIDADCTNPINVNVCNQIDLSTIESLLGDILTEVIAINENTDGIEVLLGDIITEIQNGNITLDQILNVLNNVLAELEAINENTDQIETLISSLISTVQTEFDQTQVLLQEILDRLNTDCTDPIKVEVCNQLDLSLIEGLLGNILTELQTINTNTDQLESLINTLIFNVQVGNATLVDILSVLNSVLSELEAIDENTDEIETLISTLTSTIQNEFDETQVLLQAILDRLNADCTDPLKVEVCNNPPSYDTEKRTVCYTTDNGLNIERDGELVRVYEANPDTGLPNPVPVITQLIAQDGSALNLDDPNVSVVACPPDPSVKVLQVCVQDGNGDIQAKLQHIVYGVEPNGSSNISIDNVFYTDLSGLNITYLETLVRCTEYQLGSPIISCE